MPELDRAANAGATVSRPVTMLRGRLRLDIPSAFAVQSFIAALHAFTQAHSGIELTLGVTDRAVDLVAECADRAIRLGHLADSSLVAKQLGFATMVTCAATGCVAKFGAPESPDALHGHALVGVYFWREQARAAMEFHHAWQGCLTPARAGCW